MQLLEEDAFYHNRYFSVPRSILLASGLLSDKETKLYDENVISHLKSNLKGPELVLDLGHNALHIYDTE